MRQRKKKRDQKRSEGERGEEGVKMDTYHLGTLVVLLVFLHDEQIHSEGSHGVQEGEDGDGDEELGRGGVVSLQEEALSLAPSTGRSVKVHLVQPRGREHSETYVRT